jgi:hypothetical protein
MMIKVRLFRRLKAMARSASARQGVRAALDQLGRSMPGPGVGAVIASIVGVLIAPCAVVVDYFLLASIVDFVVSLAAVGSSLYARYLVPMTLVLVEVGVSLRRSQDQHNPYQDANNRHWMSFVLAVIGIQGAAAVAQYIALQASTPSSANAVVLLFLGLLAIVTHAATLFLTGDGILLLASVIAERHRSKKRAKLNKRLRRLTQVLLQHYQHYKDLSRQYRQQHTDAPEIELDSVTLAELRDAAGTPPENTPPPDPKDPNGSSASAGFDMPLSPNPSEPPNPYDQWDEDQRL